jgi:IS5 family transposase
LFTADYLAGSQGDAINAVLAATGYNFRFLLNWLRFLLRLIASLILPRSSSTQRPQIA